MLILEKPLAEGMMRTCYLHPQDEQKCVKVVKKKSDVKILEKELRVYQKVKASLMPFICHYDDLLVETNKGPGLVGELIRDDDGKAAQKLSVFLAEEGGDDSLKQHFDTFFKIILQNRFYFTDFNLDNFLVFYKNKKITIRYIDLKSYRDTKAAIKLEIVLPFLWRIKTLRRMNHFYHRLGWPPPELQNNETCSVQNV